MMNGNKVVAVKAVDSDVDMWSADSFLPGDILRQVKAPMAPTSVVTGGRSALERELRNFIDATGVVVTVQRGGTDLPIPARVVLVVKGFLKRHRYFLAADSTPGYLCTLSDLAVDDCKSLQETTRRSMEKRRITIDQESGSSNLAVAKDTCRNYGWKWKMQTFFTGSTTPFSLLVMPHQPDRLARDYEDVEKTLARTMAWLTAAQCLGVPITIVNIQTEPFLLQGPGFKATGLARHDPDKTANAGVYTVQAYDGLDIEVVRAVRLWYAPVGELAVELRPRNGENRLGAFFGVTDEGFCHISLVEEGTAADRAGLMRLHQAALRAKKLLVISKFGEVKVTPWMVMFSGEIRGFQIDTISERLCLPRQAGKPVQLHVMWEDVPLTDMGNLSEVMEPVEAGPSNSADL